MVCSLHGIAHDRGVLHALRGAVGGHRGRPLGEAAGQRAAAGLRLGEAARELCAAGLEAVEPQNEGAAAARRLRGAAGGLGGAAGQRACPAGQGAGAGAAPAHAGPQRAGALGERARPVGHRLRTRVGLGDRRLVGGERAGELRAAAVELGGARLELLKLGRGGREAAVQLREAVGYMAGGARGGLQVTEVGGVGVRGDVGGERLLYLAGGAGKRAGRVGGGRRLGGRRRQSGVHLAGSRSEGGRCAVELRGAARQAVEPARRAPAPLARL